MYAESRSLRAVSAVHAGIIDTWRDDFPKYAARRDLTRMLRVFSFAARRVGRKVKYSNVSPDDQSATIRRDIDLLAMAIEVKAGRTGTLRSLHQFVTEKRTPVAVRFDAELPALHTVDAQVRRGRGTERVRYRLVSLPLYLVERLPQIVEELHARV